MRLFLEYCKVKFANISESLQRLGERASPQEIQIAVIRVAQRFLVLERTSLRTNDIRSSLSRKAPLAAHLLQALLDEDIIFEETPDIYDPSRTTRRISFVYEAFMEFLMAQALLSNSKGRDDRLASDLRRLYAREKRFPHIRGIGTYLLPWCVAAYPKSYVSILRRLETVEYVDTYVPSLLNLWDSDWTVGIWPVLRSMSENLLALPIDETRAYFADWIGAHDCTPFLASVASDPAIVHRLLGDRGPQLIFGIDRSIDDLYVQAVIKYILEIRTPRLLEQCLEEIRRSELWSSVIRGDAPGKQIPSAVLDSLSRIATLHGLRRDSSSLWRLAELCMTTTVDPGELSKHAIQLRPIIEEICQATFYRSRRWSKETLWLARLGNMDPKKISERVEANEEDELRGMTEAYLHYQHWTERVLSAGRDKRVKENARKEVRDKTKRR